MSHNVLPSIAVTIGDPAGIGPEVVAKALSDSTLAKLAHWIVVGDAAIVPLRDSDSIRWLDLKQLSPARVTPGKLNADCARAALAYVRRATELCLRSEVDAMVTAPLNKEAIALTGEKFTGHTEFIAKLCGVKESRMLLVNHRLRVIHVTTHCPLRKACDVSFARVLETIRMGHEALEWLGATRKKIAVCGLNPHAGENGIFGDEDRKTIAPAINAAREEGILCEGPFAADTIFLNTLRGEYDLVVAMYHDQGHIPIKLVDFERTVNVSLGLPIIRTSVDHGTAFDIAGKGMANACNMKAAMSLAALLACRRCDFSRQ